MKMRFLLLLSLLQPLTGHSSSLSCSALLNKAKIVTLSKNLNDSKSIAKANVKAFIDFRLKAGLSLAPSYVRDDKSKSSLNALKDIFGENLSGNAFFIRSKRLYGSWNEALKAHGVDPHSVVKKTLALDKVTVEKALLGLKAHISDWSDGSVKENTDPKISKVIKNITKRDVSLKQLYRFATKEKSWSEWIETLGLDVRVVSKGNIKISNKEIISVIKALNQHKDFSVNIESIRKLESRRSVDLVEKAIGLRLSPKRIYHHAVKDSRPWDSWLKDSGLDPRKVKKSWVSITDQEIILVLKAIEKTKGQIPLNAGSISTNSSAKLINLVQKTIGIPRTGKSIYAAATARKQWAVWLSEIGLDVTKVQLSGKIPYKLVNKITQASLQDAQSYKESLLGTDLGYESGKDGRTENVQIDIVTPETLVHEKQFNDRFSHFSDRLIKEERVLLDEIINILETGGSVSEILKGSIQVDQLTFSEADVMELFDKIKTDPVFIELMMSGS